MSLNDDVSIRTMGANEAIKFEVETFLNTPISVSERYWNYITTVKHPYMRDKEEIVVETLKDPEIIRQSRTDENVYLFYRRIMYDGKQYHTCVVVNGTEGFVITTYITHRIKEGHEIWRR